MNRAPTNLAASIRARLLTRSRANGEDFGLITFERRQTPVPTTLPVGLSDNFAADDAKRMQWQAFIRRSKLADADELAAIIMKIRAFLWPIIELAKITSQGRESRRHDLLTHWPPGGPWQRP